MITVEPRKRNRRPTRITRIWPAAGGAAGLGLAGTLWALSEVLENDTNGDGIADYLEFINDTDPLDPNGPPEFNHHWIVKVNGFLIRKNEGERDVYYSEY